MIKHAVTLLAAILVVSCGYGDSRQFDLRYPATLNVRNSSGITMTIESIYSIPESGGGFILNGKTLSNNEITSLRISESSYEIISNKDYFIDGHCGDNQTWTLSGESLTLTLKGDKEINVVIKMCPS